MNKNQKNVIKSMQKGKKLDQIYKLHYENKEQKEFINDFIYFKNEKIIHEEKVCTIAEWLIFHTYTLTEKGQSYGKINWKAIISWTMKSVGF